MQAAAPVAPTGPVTEERLRTAVDRIVAALDPEQIVLFGSYAYGEPSPDSDVDLLVVMETDDRTPDRIRRVSRLLSPRPFPVDVVVRTPREISQGLDRVDPFTHEIMAKGRVLYERS